MPKITNFFIAKDNEVHDESASESEKGEDEQMINETNKHLLLEIGDPGCSFISASSEVHEFIEADINSYIEKEKKGEASQQQVRQEPQDEEIINSNEITKLLKVSEWSAEIIRTDKFIESTI